MNDSVFCDTCMFDFVSNSDDAAKSLKLRRIGNPTWALNKSSCNNELVRHKFFILDVVFAKCLRASEYLYNFLHK